MDTKLQDLFVPEVVGPEIETKLANDIRFLPFAKFRYTLEGRAGNTVTRWFWKYIGDAEEFNEGEAISYGQLGQDTKEVTVKKAGRGVKLTDEAVLSGQGDPEGEAVAQVRLAIARKINADCKTVLDSIASGMTVGDGTGKLNASLIQDALTLFGEDFEGPKAILISPKQRKDLMNDAEFIPASEIKAEMMITGSLGQILGCDIIVSNDVVEAEGKYNNYLLKGTPLAIEIKRGIMPEKDRDIDKKITKFNADIHYVTYLEEEQNAIKIVSSKDGE